jgi:uncharacterized phage protein (TIGR01671 family)
MRELDIRFWMPETPYVSNAWMCYDLAGDIMGMVIRKQKPYQDVIPMLFSGHKDEDGKKVYDGDIVTRKNRSDLHCLVYFEEADYSYRLAVRGDKQIDKTYMLNFTGKVIGNIFENPDLL